MNNSIKEEWIDGNIMMSPRPQYNHVIIENELYFQLRKFFDNRCSVVMEGALFLSKDNPVELKKDFIKLKELVSAKKAELVPDIAVYCDKNQMFKRGFLGIPQLVIEVLSPSNHTDDTLKKYKVYEEFGVPEYWIVNPETNELFIYAFKNDRYELVTEFNFLQQEIKSIRFEDLVVDIKNITLYSDDDDI